MLTIKHIAMGFENIFPAKGVMVTYWEEKVPKVPTALHFLSPHANPADFGVPITTGEVYVMNENGKTVASYKFPKDCKEPAPELKA